MHSALTRKVLLFLQPGKDYDEKQRGLYILKGNRRKYFCQWQKATIINKNLADLSKFIKEIIVLLIIEMVGDRKKQNCY